MNALNGAERRRTGERKLACMARPLAHDVGWVRVGASRGREGYQLLLLLPAEWEDTERSQKQRVVRKTIAGKQITAQPQTLTSVPHHSLRQRRSTLALSSSTAHVRALPEQPICSSVLA